MLTIKTFQCNMLSENCYIVNDETKECMRVGCGAHGPFEKAAIEKRIKQNEL